MTEEAQQFEFAVTVAQIFSGVTFTLVAIWMTFSNGVSLAFIQRASLEKRLTVCCFLNTYVGMFSAFFNFFQLTKVDDLILPEQSNYAIDLARPIEWIATCPLMQLCLVILGGSKVPDIRRVVMPGLSIVVLCFGLTSTFLQGTARFIPYAFGLLCAMLMFYLNAKQIVEHSDGLETFFRGDSEYRKASLLVILLWFPFPIWYFLSPEGMGLISDVLLIQVGWAFLNIVSKFTFIFYIQRMKDNYCTKLKAKRECYQARGTKNEVSGDLTAVLLETLSFLGMAQHSDRIILLFSKAGLTTSAELCSLTQEACKDRRLPWDVVRAVQQRMQVWRLETQDNAEADIEEGEGHYLKRSKPHPNATCEDGNSSGTFSTASLGIPLELSQKARKKIREAQQARIVADVVGDVDMKLSGLSQKLDNLQLTRARAAVEEEACLLGKIEVMMDSSASRGERIVTEMGTVLRDDMKYLLQSTSAIQEQVAASSEAQESSMSDMRRQHMMLMELVSSDRDALNAQIGGLSSKFSGRELR